MVLPNFKNEIDKLVTLKILKEDSKNKIKEIKSTYKYNFDLFQNCRDSYGFVRWDEGSAVIAVFILTIVLVLILTGPFWLVSTIAGIILTVCAFGFLIFLYCMCHARPCLLPRDRHEINFHRRQIININKKLKKYPKL